MLKRYQVLLTDWLGDYMQQIGKNYDASFSEIVRVNCCIGLLIMIESIIPGYKIPIDIKKMLARVKKIKDDNLDYSEVHEMISSLYFEARKAIEYRDKYYAKRPNERQR